MSADPFGRALRDHYRGEREAPLLQRDGESVREHPVEQFYFWEFAGEEAVERWIASRLDGPLLDLGAGVGAQALYFQEQFETVAIEVSEHLVETLRSRGVADARHADMFALRDTFGRDRFQSALAHGTQAGLAGSIQGLRQFLGDLAFVTTPDATAVLDFYDPTKPITADLLGYRADPSPGLASRVMHFEYEGEVGDTLLFRLFAPDRLHEAAVGTGWEVTDVENPDVGHPGHYHVALAKR